MTVGDPTMTADEFVAAFEAHCHEIPKRAFGFWLAELEKYSPAQLADAWHRFDARIRSAPDRARFLGLAHVEAALAAAKREHDRAAPQLGPKCRFCNNTGYLAVMGTFDAKSHAYHLWRVCENPSENIIYNAVARCKCGRLGGRMRYACDAEINGWRKYYEPGLGDEFWQNRAKNYAIRAMWREAGKTSPQYFGAVYWAARFKWPLDPDDPVEDAFAVHEAAMLPERRAE